MKSWSYLFVGVAMFGTGVARSATTYQELAREVAVAEEGATVYVENDMEATGVLKVGKRVTIASPLGQTNVITRAASYAGIFVDLTDAADDLTLERVVLDWNKAAGRATRFAQITAGRMTLNAGVELRNCSVKEGASGGIYVNDAGRLVMNEGAVIRGFEVSGFAMAVQIGTGKDGVTPVFEMNGGLITECADHYGSSKNGYGGAVYVWGGDFVMHGGTITGNTSDNNVGGVVSWNGRWLLSGPAYVTNNVGVYANDVSVGGGKGGWISFDGDYLGRMTLRSNYDGMPDSPSQWGAYNLRPGQPVVGAGNVSSQRDPNRIIDDLGTGGSLYFKTRLASIGPGRYDTYDFANALRQTRNGETILFTTNALQRGQILINGVQWNGLSNVTLAGSPEAPVVVSRSLTEARSMLVVSNATVRLEHFVLDGIDMAANPLATILDFGDLTLGPGAVLKNGRTSRENAAVRVVSSGAHLTMEEGSVVSDCTTVSNLSFATAIRVGANSKCAVEPLFEMKGGVITNCESLSVGAASGGYGGAVYVQNARFVMSGGKIAGNKAPGSCAGVMVFDGGRMDITGTARIENNWGASPDLYRVDKGSVNMVGDFRGWVGVSCGEQVRDKPVKILAEAGSTGAWNFFSAGTEPYGQFVGYNWSSAEFAGGNDQIYWGVANGWVDGVGFPSTYESKNMIASLPSVFDLDDADAPQPHVLAGTACTMDKTVELVFDEARLRASNRLPLLLVTATDRPLTGMWDFTVPKSANGKWVVRAVRSAAGVTGYALDWSKVGMMMIIR